jgi:hypothetical protein
MTFVSRMIMAGIVGRGSFEFRRFDGPLIALVVELYAAIAAAKGGKFRSDFEARLCRDCSLQNDPNLSFSASTVVGRAQLECAMGFLGKVANGDGGHGPQLPIKMISMIAY